MTELLAQGGVGSTGILTNKQAIARKFGVKQSEVVYFSVGVALFGYKVIYDKENQRAYSLPTGLVDGTQAVSLGPDATLVHSSGYNDLGQLAQERGEFIVLPGSFDTGAVVNTHNEVLTYGDKQYFWAGALPKTVSSASSPKTSGGIGANLWVVAGITGSLDSLVSGTIFPSMAEASVKVGDTIPAGTSHLVVDGKLREVVPPISGTITAITGSSVSVGSSTSTLVLVGVSSTVNISACVDQDADVSDVIPALLTKYETIVIDIPVTLSNNVVSALDSKRIISNGKRITFVGSSFDTSKGAIELTGNYTEVSGIEFFSNTTEVTPVRLGNVAYGSSDSSRRVGIRSNKCVFNNTGFKGPNHGNLVIIGAMYPEITLPRFIGQPKAGGNMEVLGVKGGFCSHGYAENGLLINFHGTSADGTGFPTTDFQFLDCEGLMNSAVLGSVNGAVGGNNNIKFSRGCSNCRVSGGRFTSVAAGAFNGNDHVIALQGCSNNVIENVFISTTNNGDYKAAFGISDHNASLTDGNDNVIRNCFVQMNTPGQYNRILQIQSTSGKGVRRNKLLNVGFNCYNGSNTVDAICEQTGTVSGNVSDTHVYDCTGQGVKDTLLNRTGLADSAITYLKGNRILNVFNSSVLNSGKVFIVDSPIILNINNSGALANATNCVATKNSPGVWTITTTVDISKATFAFSSPGISRYCTVVKNSSTSWTVSMYNSTATIADMEASITISL